MFPFVPRRQRASSEGVPTPLAIAVVYAFPFAIYIHPCRYMFRSAKEFNSDLSKWNVKKVDSFLCVVFRAISFTTSLASSCA